MILLHLYWSFSCEACTAFSYSHSGRVSWLTGRLSQKLNSPHGTSAGVHLRYLIWPEDMEAITCFNHSPSSSWCYPKVWWFLMASHCREFSFLSLQWQKDAGGKQSGQNNEPQCFFWQGCPMLGQTPQETPVKINTFNIQDTDALIEEPKRLEFF